jgi:hypothetical protein
VKPLLIPSLALASALFSGCPVSESDGGSSEATSSPNVVGSTPDPEISAALAKYNANLPKKGELLPDISGLTLEGESINNEWLKGKTTLINLWFYH